MKQQATVVYVLPLNSSDQLADIYNKPFAPGPFHSLTSRLSMIDMEPGATAVTKLVIGGQLS